MFDVKVLSEGDYGEIADFEKTILMQQNISEMEAEMKSWDQPWRKESMDHYIKLGWSFVARKDGEICGYILCQPLLFFQSWTQSLWIEYAQWTSEDLKKHLFEVAWKWAKTKHLQKVFVNPTGFPAEFVKENYSGVQVLEVPNLNTTKIAGE